MRSRSLAVAVIGTGRTPGGVGRSILDNIRDAGFTGRLAAAPEGCTPVFGSEAMADLYGWGPGARIELPVGPPGHCYTVGGIWRDRLRVTRRRP